MIGCVACVIPPEKVAFKKPTWRARVWHEGVIHQKNQGGEGKSADDHATRKALILLYHVVVVHLPWCVYVADQGVCCNLQLHVVECEYATYQKILAKRTS